MVIPKLGLVAVLVFLLPTIPVWASSSLDDTQLGFSLTEWISFWTEPLFQWVSGLVRPSTKSTLENELGGHYVPIGVDDKPVDGEEPPQGLMGSPVIIG